MNQAQHIDSLFQGQLTEPEQGYEINDFALGMQPIEVNHDWRTKVTRYVFEDESALDVSGPSYVTHDGLREWSIENSESGHQFGIYPGYTADDAIQAMLDDAGHDGPADEDLTGKEIA